MYEGQCHCGNVRFSVSEAPEKLVDCNCSLCRRLGALWGHLYIDKVTIIAKPGSTREYIQGDKTLALNTCNHCGCTTHYESLVEEGKFIIEQFQIRKFDGAETYKFID